jgi:lysophospholipase L1-like esterase
MKTLFRYLYIFIIQVVIFIALGEIICSWYLPTPEQKMSIHYGSAEFDKKLGWKTKANYQFQDSMKTLEGEPYSINYKTSKFGFREYGNIKTDKKKILFVGDSFTQSAEVSNDKVFYNHLKDSLEVEIFAFGVGMFGTYQEYLVVDQFIDSIQPDLVVWQFCDNDFIDNYRPLAMKCVYKSNLIRPYLVNGKTKYQISLTLMDQLRRKSNLAYAISTIFKTEPEEHKGEARIFGEGKGFPEYNEAINTTAAILKLARKRVSKEIPILGFNATGYEPQNSHLAEVCEKNNITFSYNFRKGLDSSGNHAKLLVEDQTHWSEWGHKVVANALKEDIINLLK